MTKKNNKNPILAGILNLIVPGLGYVYVGKRLVLGVGLILSLFLWFGIDFSNIPLWIQIDSIIMAFLFAYDGYKTAEEFNEN